jgi:hypothetical protein
MTTSWTQNRSRTGSHFTNMLVRGSRREAASSAERRTGRRQPSGRDLRCWWELRSCRRSGPSTVTNGWYRGQESPSTRPPYDHRLWRWQIDQARRAGTEGLDPDPGRTNEAVQAEASVSLRYGMLNSVQSHSFVLEMKALEHDRRESQGPSPEGDPNGI